MIAPQKLPAPKQLRKLMQSLAALDAIYSPEWEYRYYSFDSNWSKGEEMGSIRNGCGDTVFVFFNSKGCFLKGFAHEYPIDGKTSGEFYTNVPQEFIEASREPAFSPNNVNFCCWRQISDAKWLSAIPDTALDQNSFFLIQGLDGDEKAYHNFTSEYYEIESDIEHISSIFLQTPMTKKLAEAMNGEIEYAKLVEDLNEIGYPVNSTILSEFSKKPSKKKGVLGKLFGR